MNSIDKDRTQLLTHLFTPLPHWHVTSYSECQSTMDLVREEFERISEGRKIRWVLVTTDRQLAGRGSSGRSWQETPEGIYLSVGVGTRLSEKELSGLSLAVGVSVVDALSPFGAELSLKWPNDILTAKGKKVGGILIESHQAVQEDYSKLLVIGIGLNTIASPTLTPSESARFSSAHLFESGAIFQDRDQIILALAQSLERVFVEFETHGFDSMRTRWNENSYGLGKEVRFSIGDELVEGKLSGVAETGELILEVGGVERFFATGRVEEIGVG